MSETQQPAEKNNPSEGNLPDGSNGNPSIPSQDAADQNANSATPVPDGSEHSASNQSGAESAVPAAEISEYKDDFSFSIRSGLLPDNKRGIFVVLGDREEINQDCLSVIQKYGIEPFIIHPNTSWQDPRSVKDLLTQHPKTTFAFVLLTGDDFVYSRKDGKPATAKLKSEQEVVFILGYLLGAFGLQNVFILYKAQKSFLFPTSAQNANFVAYEKNGFWLQIFENRLKERGLLDTPK